MTISVTQLIDLFPEKELVNWMLRDPKKAKQVSEEALRVGKAVDTLAQRQYRQETVEVPLNDPPVNEAWGNWQLFLSEHPTFFPSISNIQKELIAGNYIGHPDFLRRLSSYQMGIDDLKCASQIRPNHFVQLGGYAWLLTKHALPMPTWLGIIRVGKERPNDYDYLQLTEPADIQTAIEAFLHYKGIYELRETVKRWVIQQKEAKALED